MKVRFIAAAFTALILTAGTASAQDTTSEKGKLSYYFGYDFGRSLAESGERQRGPRGGNRPSGLEPGCR